MTYEEHLAEADRLRLQAERAVMDVERINLQRDQAALALASVNIIVARAHRRVHEVIRDELRPRRAQRDLLNAEIHHYERLAQHLQQLTCPVPGCPWERTWDTSVTLAEVNGVVKAHFEEKH